MSRKSSKSAAERAAAKRNAQHAAKVAARKAADRKSAEEAARKRNAQHALASARAATQIRERALDAGFRSQLPQAQRFVVTAAQDGSPLHDGFFAALKSYCRYNNAALVVIPYLYRALNTRKQESEVVAVRWAAELHPYLFAGRQLVAPGLAIVGDVKISPTKQSPLSGLDAMTLGASAIFAHPKLELRTVPTLGSTPTILTTTGAITISDYVDALSSKIGEFHHTIGACVIEIEDDDTFHLRQINAETDSGEFIDLNLRYTAAPEPKIAPRPLAVVLGDTHVGSVDPNVEAATFGPAGIIDQLAPKHIVYHDLLDGMSMNPHHKGKPFLALAKRAAGRHKIKEEILTAARYIEERTPRDALAIVVASNHNDFLNRWMNSVDWREIADKEDVLFYLDTAKRMAEASDYADSGYTGIDPFVLWAQEIAPKAKFLRRGESFKLGGVELSQHFDIGPNGARGSLRNMSRIGTKVIGGHGHGPGIREGGVQTGTSTLLRLEYNVGASTWAHAHAVEYANGKRSLIFISHKGTWHGEVTLDKRFKGSWTT